MPLNGLTLGQTKRENINRMITTTDDFIKQPLVNGTFKCDNIKWLITLTRDYIMPPLLYVGN